MLGTLLLAATFANPVLPADFSDLDCIQQGGRYYAISSTLHCSPGMSVLESTDMVDWQVTGHVVPDTSVFGEDWTWKRMHRYGHGVWAGTIRAWKGRFYCYFGTPDEGIFVATAEQPEGPWSAPRKMAFFGHGWDDTGVLFEGDKGYLAATHFADGYKTYIFDLTPDALEVVPESRVLVNEGAGREANKLYKWNGIYYHLYSEVGGGGRRLMMQRAKSPKGPYTEKRILSYPQVEADEPNQGGFLTDDAGNWFFFTHHGHGQWYGRAASLLPVTWIDGWPVVGKPDEKGIGTMVWHPERPVVKRPLPRKVRPQGFLSPDWGWNHAPRKDWYACTDAALVLKPFRPLKTEDFFTVGNVYSRRAERRDEASCVVTLEASRLVDGNRAGLCHFGGEAYEFGVEVADGTRRLYFRRNWKEPEILAENVPPRLLLKTTWDRNGRARFAYSTGGAAFVAYAPDVQLTWGAYRGDRVGLYAYACREESGEACFQLVP